MKFVFVFLFGLVAQNAFAQTAMFRGTPDHNSSCQTNKQIIFTDEAWSFNANAPVRSTAVASSSIFTTFVSVL